MSMEPTEETPVKGGALWLEKLYKETYPVLNTYAMLILEDPILAEKAVQDAFCIICTEREQLLSSDSTQSRLMRTLKCVIQGMRRNRMKSNT